MAQLWFENQKLDWEIAPLDRDSFFLSWKGVVAEGACPPATESDLAAVLRRLLVGSEESWTL
ncbi:MAG: hypothetical protein IH987_21455, partial [Planctomycetes bacterium]|nr:hypothetical protein [Planctomycetota bacterium]